MTEDEQIDAPICPVCDNKNNKLFLGYSGNFLGIKELYQCEICELIFGHKIPNKNEVDQYYESGHFYEAIPNKFDQQLLNWHFKVSETRLNIILKNVKNNFQNVIDIGGGYAKFGHVLQVKGYDASYDIIEPDPTVSNVWGDWVNNNFNHVNQVRDNFYDLAILCHVLEHVTDPMEFINLIKSKMKPKGHIFIDVPYKDYLFKETIDPHITFWNHKSIENLVIKNDLKLVFIKTVGLSHRACQIMFKNKSFFQKIVNPWIYVNKIKNIIKRDEIPFFTDELMFGLNKYGGNRMWLRCILRLN